MINVSLAAFSAAFLLVVLAEMGDKTQFVAMTFAVKYSPFKVLLAVFLSTIANFAIVIAIGQVLIEIVPIDAISLAASISFIGFGLWTLREEKAKRETLKASRFGVVAAIALAFFLAEFGDKTQLTTLSLAVQYHNPIGVLAGATLGMLIADGIAIVIGVVFCRRIEQRLLRWISSITFVVFGLVGVYQILLGKVGWIYIAAVLLGLALFSFSVMVFVARKPRKQKNESNPCVKD